MVSLLLSLQRLDVLDERRALLRVVLEIDHRVARCDRLGVGEPAFQQSAIPGLSLHGVDVLLRVREPRAARRLPAEEAEQVRPDAIRLALAEGVALGAAALRETLARGL